MATHTDKGIPIVSKEVVREVFELPQADTDGFFKQKEELINRMCDENPALADGIACMKMSMQFVSPMAANYFLDCVVQIFQILEKSEEEYRKG